MVIKYVLIPAPEEVFDVEGATITRRKRISVAAIDAMDQIRRTGNDVNALYRAMAELIPEWDGILHVDTGEPLPNPKEDPAAFAGLDVTEQLPWLGEVLKMNPGKLRKAQGRGPT